MQVWLKQPLVNLDDINCRLNVVQSFVEDPTLRESLRDMHLRGAWPAARLQDCLLLTAEPLLLVPVSAAATAAAAITECSKASLLPAQLSSAGFGNPQGAVMQLACQVTPTSCRYSCTRSRQVPCRAAGHRAPEPQVGAPQD